MAHYLVTFGRGQRWDRRRARRNQAGWDDHAAFIDDLKASGTVDTGDALVLVSATYATQAEAVFDTDPWHETVLTTTSVVRWTLWLGPFDG